MRAYALKYNPFTRRSNSKRPDEESGLGLRNFLEIYLKPIIKDTALLASTTTEKPPLIAFSTSKESATTSNRLKFKNPLYKSTKENKDLDYMETKKSIKSKRQKAVFKLTIFVGFIVNYLNINSVTIFIINFIAIIPLTIMLSYATKEITLRVSKTLGSLLNATFSLLALYISSLIIPTVFHSILLTIILLVSKRKSSKVKKGGAFRKIAQIGIRTAAISKGRVNQEQLIRDLNIEGALITLTISTTLVAFCSKFIVNSISEVIAGSTISTTFISLILLLIVSNATKYVIAVIVAYKDKIDLVIGITILFVTVLLVNYLI
ncbi:calcium/proton exchanger [Cenococcum geophilum]